MRTAALRAAGVRGDAGAAASEAGRAAGRRVARGPGRGAVPGAERRGRPAAGQSGSGGVHAATARHSHRPQVDDRHTAAARPTWCCWNGNRRVARGADAPGRDGGIDLVQHTGPPAPSRFAPKGRQGPGVMGTRRVPDGAADLEEPLLAAARAGCCGPRPPRCDTGLPSTSAITSPACRPARAAGLPGCTSVTIAPRVPVGQPQRAAPGRRSRWPARRRCASARRPRRPRDRCPAPRWSTSAVRRWPLPPVLDARPCSRSRGPRCVSISALASLTGLLPDRDDDVPVPQAGLRGGAVGDHRRA